MTGRKAGRRLGAVFVLVGGLILAAALFTPWYASHRDATAYPSGTSFTTESLYYLGLPTWHGTVQFSCNYSPCPSETSYSGLSLNGTGVVAAATLFFASATSALGLISGTLGIVYHRNEKRTFAVPFLGGGAVVMGIVASWFYAGAIQSGLAHPWSSFWGSSNGYDTLGPWTDSWGPSIGWYLSIAAIAALLVGAVLVVRFRHDVAESVPSTASADPTQESNPRNSGT